MPTLSDSSIHEDEHDIVAEYENRGSDDERGSVGRYEDAGSDNENKDDAGTRRRIDPSTSKKHVVRNPIPKLNTERLKGPKGIHTIEKYFEGFKFHGKGHEKTDLDRIMKRMEHWGHRLFPKLDFDDFLDRIQKLGTKKDLQVFVKKYRMDMITADEDLIVNELMDVEEDNDQSEPIDEFDILIAEQIEKQKQMTIQHESSIAGGSADNTINISASEMAFNRLSSNFNHQSSQSSSQPKKETNVASQLTDQVKERIERNRQQAIQRKLARQAALREEAERKKLEESNDASASEPTSSHISEDHLSNKSQDLNETNPENLQMPDEFASS